MGTVFSIEEFSVYDGPGIRSTVFLKGCPLRCSWCHNPEGQHPEPEIIRNPNGCVKCGNCLKFSIRKRDKIQFTEKSMESCPGNLLRICGEEMDSDTLCGRLLKNERILKNGGGVTFSGGEPLLQYLFVKKCIWKIKGILHTAIQTSGFCEQKHFEEMLTCVDYVLFDLKLADEELHKKYTGVSNEKILNNYSILTKSNVPYVTRIPLIPGVTDTYENISALIEIMKINHVNYAELLPYNKMAGGKYAMLQRKYEPGFDETQDIIIRKDLFLHNGIDVKVL